MPHRSKLKIFLADDLADRRANARHQLETMGYAAVFSFASPDACLKRLPLRPDLVLLPVPVKSPQGMDLQRRIRAFNRRIMVMYIGDAPETQLEAAMRRAEKTCSYRRLKEAIVRKIKAVTALVAPAGRQA